MPALQETTPIAITSARPDGATSVAAALAALLSTDSRTLLCDLNLRRPEVAPLLDLDESRSIYHLAYGAQLAPVTAEDLETHIAWHEGLAIVPGISQAREADYVTDHFLSSLLDTAVTRFEWLVWDLGRVQTAFPDAATSGLLLWVVAPTRLGLAAFDRAWRQLMAEEATWPSTAKVVINQAGAHSLRGVSAFLERNYGLEVVGELPQVFGFWQQVEMMGSLQAVSAEVREQNRRTRAYGEEAARFRASLADLAQKVIKKQEVALPSEV